MSGVGVDIRRERVAGVGGRCEGREGGVRDRRMSSHRPHALSTRIRVHPTCPHDTVRNALLIRVLTADASLTFSSLNPYHFCISLLKHCAT